MAGLLVLGGWDLARLPLPLLQLGIVSFPGLVAFLAAVMYKADYLKSRSSKLFNGRHIEEFDFIVVGAGSAGSVLVNRLSKDPTVRVLTLEAAGNPHPISYIPSTAVYIQRLDGTDWRYMTEPQRNCSLAMEQQRVPWPRGKGLGGSSNLNLMVYQRGNPRDYDQLAELTGDPEWSYEQVLPFFKKSEDYHGHYRDPQQVHHGRGGELYVEALRETYLAEEFLAAAKEMGFEERDLNARQTSGFCKIDATVRQGVRWNTYEAFIRPVLHRRNLVVYRYARVVKVHLDRSRRAYGVTYWRHGVQKFVRARREIILSAGAIESPKLLLLSGIGPREHLHAQGLPCRVNLPGVGENLQDHLATLMGPFLLNGKSLVVERDLNKKEIKRYLTRREGLAAGLGALSALGWVSSSLSGDPTWPDLNFHMVGLGVSNAVTEALTEKMGLKRGILQQYLRPYEGRDANMVLTMLGRPKSRGWIRLASRSPWDKPLIQPNYFSHPEDLPRMVEAFQFLVNMYENTTTYRRLQAHLAENPFPGCEAYPVKSTAYFECYVRQYTSTIYHPSGTCGMGKTVNDPGAVVDSQLRVRHVQGLRVADASVLRVITNANLNAPCIMIGERAAFLIRRYWAQHRQVSYRPGHYFFPVWNQQSFYRGLI